MVGKISDMPAGRELDALVAVAIGWQVDDMTAVSPTGSRNSRHKGDDNWLEYYSTDMGAAWQVVEFLYRKFFVVVAASPSMASCMLKKQSGIEFTDYAPTAPLAICRAALLAVNGGV